MHTLCARASSLLAALLLVAASAPACSTSSGSKGEPTESAAEEPNQPPAEADSKKAKPESGGEAEARGSSADGADSSAAEPAKLSEILPESEVTDCQSLASGTKQRRSEGDYSDLKPFRATGPVATIDGEPISAETFNRTVSSKFGRARRPMPKRIAEKQADQVLESLVDKQLIEGRLESFGAAAEPDAIRTYYQQFKERFPEERAFESFLKMQKMSRRQLVVQICKDVRLRQYLTEKRGVDVAESDVRTYYDEHAREFEQPAKVEASHILVELGEEASSSERDEARERARELLEKARDSETDFAKLAREHSDGPSAKRGGDLGYFPRERMVEPFSDAAFGAKPGTIVGPVETEFGFHVIKVHDKKPAGRENFEEARSEIREKLERRAFRDGVQKLVGELRDEHTVNYRRSNVVITAEERDAGLEGGLKKRMMKKLRNKDPASNDETDENDSNESEDDEADDDSE